LRASRDGDRNITEVAHQIGIDGWLSIEERMRRWRILQDDGALWKDVLKEKYGPKIGDLLHMESVSWPWYVSKWWKDIATLDEGGGTSWFNAEVTRRVHNGNNTSFWCTKWRGEMTLRNKYPRLFSISNQKEAKVVHMYVEG